MYVAFLNFRISELTNPLSEHPVDLGPEFSDLHVWYT